MFVVVCCNLDICQLWIAFWGHSWSKASLKGVTWLWLSKVILSVTNTLQGVLSFLIIKQDLKMLVNCFKKSLSESIQSFHPLRCCDWGLSRQSSSLQRFLQGLLALQRVSMSASPAWVMDYVKPIKQCSTCMLLWIGGICGEEVILIGGRGGASVYVWVRAGLMPVWLGQGAAEF